MAKIFVCRIIPGDPSLILGKPQQKRNGTSGFVSVLQIHSSAGVKISENLVFRKPQDLNLNYGDTIKCVSGMAAVMINPGTRAGTYILCSEIPPGKESKFKTEIQIDDETTRVVSRGKINVAGDIGTVLTATGGVTR